MRSGLIDKNKHRLKRRGSSFGKKVFFFLLGLFLTSLVFLPRILSTPKGTAFLVSLCNKYSQGKVAIQALDLHWQGPQRIQGLVVQDSQGEPLFTSDEIKATTSLRGYLLQKNLGHIILYSPYCKLAEKKTPPAPISSKKSSPTPLAALIPTSFSCEIQKGKVALVPLETKEVVFLEEIFVESDVEKASSCRLSLRAQVSSSQETKGLVELKTDIRLPPEKPSRNSPDNTLPSIQVEAHLVDLPTKALDYLAPYVDPSLQGAIQEALGPTCQMTLRAKNSGNEVECQTDFTSSFLSAHLSTTLSHKEEGKQEKVQLQKPAQVHFILTPSLGKKLFPSLYAALPIEKPRQIDLLVEELSIPLLPIASNNTLDLLPLDLDKLSGKLQVYLSRVETLDIAKESLLSQAKNGKREKEASFSLTTNQLAKELHYELHIDRLPEGALPEKKNPPPALVIKGALKHPLQKKLQITSEAHLENIPLERLLLKEALPYLGSPFSGKIQAEGELSLEKEELFSEGKLSLEGATPFVQISPLKLEYREKTLHLQAPVKVQYLPSPLCTLLKSTPIVNQVPFLENLTKSSWQMEVDSFFLPFSSSFEPSYQKTELTTRLHLPYAAKEGPFFPSLLMELAVNTLDEISLVVKEDSLEKASEKKAILSLVGALENCGESKSTSFSWGKSLEKKREDDKSPRLTLKKPLLLEYTFSPEQLAQGLSLVIPRMPTFLSSVHVNGQIEPCSFSMQNPLPSELKGKLIIDPCTIQESDGKKKSLETYTLSATTARGHWKKDHLEAHFSTALSPSVAKEKKASTLALELHLEKGQGQELFPLDFTKALGKGKLQVENFPALLIEKRVPGLFLSSLIGPHIDLSLEGSFTPSEPAPFSFQVKSAYVESRGKFLWKDRMVKTVEPFSLEYQLDREKYQLLCRMFGKENSTASFPLELIQPASLQITLTDLVVPIASEGFDYPRLRVAGKATLNQFFVQNSLTQETIYLDKLSFTCDKPSSKNPRDNPLRFSLKASCVAEEGKKSSKDSLQAGFLKLKGTWGLPGGAQDPMQDLVLDLDLQMEQFPVTLIQAGMQMGGSSLPLSDLVGNTLDARLETSVKRWDGPLSFQLKTPTLKMQAKGALHQGTLTLKEPLIATLNMNSTINRLLLKEINPLSSSAVAFDKPVSLHVDPQQFSAQVYPFSLEQLHIPSVQVDLGRVECSSEGLLGTLLNLLKKGSLSSRPIPVWFAPFDLRMNEGLIELERTEILIADAFQVATWGKVDLRKDYVDMTLGLTEPCLQKAFGIKKLPEEYVLPIAMKGKTDHVQINTAKATAKIAALIAWQQKMIAGAIGGGVPGAILGKLLDFVGDLPDKNASIPPARPPFPWGSLQKEEPREEKKPPSDNPLQKILPKKLLPKKLFPKK